MKTLKYLAFCIPFMLCSANANAQSGMYQESMQERFYRQPSYDEFLVGEIRKLPEVKRKEEQILQQSNKQHFAIFLVNSDGLGTYTVKVQEDNGKTQITHMQYVIDSASGKILSPKK